MSRRTGDAPHFAGADYATLPYACEGQQEGGQVWYRGSGVEPAEHPLSGYIAFGGCHACGAPDVLVIAAHHDVHPMNGDEYYDYELVCRVCGRFSGGSYADNG